jgi:heme o synthase
MARKIKSYVLLFFRFIKVTVALPVTFLAFAGFIFYSNRIELTILLPVSGVFLLVCAALILNQVFEKDTDKLMERTRNRPLANDEIKTFHAIIISTIFIVAGIILLYNIKPLGALLGVINLIWYICVYTPLKKVTPFAVIPGALIGAITFMIGWTIAGGSIIDYRFLLVAFFVFMWQIPHFWLLMLIYGDEYEKAGFPTIFKIFNDHLIRLWTLGWIVAACIVSLFFPAFHIISGKSMFHAILGFQSLVLFYSIFALLGVNDKNRLKILFHLVNLLLFLVMALLVVESLVK